MMDTRNKIIIALSVALLALAGAVAVFVPEVGKAIAAVLTTIAVWLGGSEVKRKTGGGAPDPTDDPVTVADDAEKETDEVADEEAQPSDGELVEDFEEIANE